MSAYPYNDPFDPTRPIDSNPAPVPFTGGSNIAPMPVDTGKGNPYADVLNHVAAWNTALSGATPTAAPQAFAFSTVQNPDGGPFDPNDPTGGHLPDPGSGSGTDQSDPRGRASVPPPPAPSDPRSRSSNPPPVYSAANPPPKPSDLDMANPEVAADWYRKFAYENPAYANITASDVNAYRSNHGGMVFNEWYLAGNRGPTAAGTDPNGNPTPADPGKGLGQAQPPAGTPPLGGGPYVPPYVAANDPNNPNAKPPAPLPNAPGGPKLPPVDPVVPYTGPAPPPDPNAPPGATPPGTTPPVDPNAPPPGGTPSDIQKLIDMFKAEAGSGNGPDIESMLNPMFARQRQKLDETLRAGAALTPGRLESGGFGMNEGQALSDLSGVQSGKMADLMQQENLAKMQQNTQLITLGTQAGMQKYVADLNADLTKFQVNTNADLQKWLDNADNALKKWGIDTGDVLARYQADLQLKGQQYSADRGVDAASLQASAAGAAAGASAAASRANAQLQYQLGMQGLNVDREKNIGQFILGLLGQGNMDLNTLNGILNGILPGTVVTKP